MGLALSGCGGSSGTGAEPSPSLTAASESATGVPPEAVLLAWPQRWCEVRIGDSREQVAQIMGAAPTKADSTVVAHIPYVHLNNRGENANPPPAPAADADTWAVKTPNLVLFNAFYDASFHVQQLDVDGDVPGLACSATRVR